MTPEVALIDKETNSGLLASIMMPAPFCRSFDPQTWPLSRNALRGDLPRCIPIEKRQGLTLAETLVSISIIEVLMGLFAPVLTSVKMSANISRAKSNLHQQWLGIKLYQEANGGEGSWGTASEMNLPDVFAVVQTPYLGLGRDVWISPCGKHPLWPSPETYSFRIYPDTTNDHRTRDAALLYQDNMVATVDPQCNSAAVNIFSASEVRFGLGVLLSGQLVQKMKRGDWYDYEWWAPQAR